MADVLSQQEIDALLSAITSGELQASEVASVNDKVKTYDFKRAMRYSKEQLRSIMRIHENFIRLFASHLSAQLRTLVKLEIELADQVNYQEFIASMPSKTIVNIFTAAPMDAKMVMEVTPQVTYGILDRLLGGPGENAAYDGQLTEIENALIQRVFSNAANIYQEVWRGVENIRVRWDSIETNPQFLQIASQNDTVIILALKASIGDTLGRMTICLPHLFVESLLPKLSTHQLLSSMSKTAEPRNQKLLERNLDDVDVTMIAELGRAMLPVSDVANLQIGDVIGIETGPLRLKVAGETRFLSTPGQQKGHYAIQIDEVIEMKGEQL